MIKREINKRQGIHREWRGRVRRDFLVNMIKVNKSKFTISKIFVQGADVIGLNCCFDPQRLIEAVKVMKEALEKAGYKKHLICQPVGSWTPEVKRGGWVNLPEWPLGKHYQFSVSKPYFALCRASWKRATAFLIPGTIRIVLSKV